MTDPLQFISDGLENLVLLALPSESFGRIKVMYSCSAGDQVIVSPRLRIAFDMLQRRAPMWYRRVQNELREIVVIPVNRGGVGGWYERSSGRCIINATPLLEQGNAGAIGVMFILVHETTHAWLHRHRVRFIGEKGRIREERMCYRAEATLAARLPEFPELARAVARRAAAIPGEASQPRGAEQTDVLEHSFDQFIGRLFGPKG